MREYEIMWIIAPTETEEGVQAIVTQYEELLTSLGAEMIKTDVWGRRKLAYPIKKFREGVYVLFHLNSEHEAVHELERRFKMSENIIRSLVVRMDEDMKRARKREAARAARRRAKGIEDPPVETPQDADSQAVTPVAAADGDKVESEAPAEKTAEETPEAKPEAEPEAKPEAEPEAKPEAEPEAKPDAEPEAKPEAEPEPEAKTESGDDAETESTDEPEGEKS